MHLFIYSLLYKKYSHQPERAIVWLFALALSSFHVDRLKYIGKNVDYYIHYSNLFVLHFYTALFAFCCVKTLPYLFM